jgi:uncharacterized membrane protein YphA (DoxX/SURF4 family)
MNRNSYLSFIPALLLAVFFVFAGQAKLTPLLSPDMHAEMLAKSPTWSAAMPFIPLSSHDLRVAIGCVELGAAALLLIAPLRRVGASLLFVVMAGAVYTHYELNEDFTFPAILAAGAAVVWLLSGKPPAARRGKKNA